MKIPNIAGWFRRNNTIMAQAKDLSRRVQEARDVSAGYKEGYDERGKSCDYLEEQLHRVARERYEERALKQAAFKTAAKLTNELALADAAVIYWRDTYEAEHSKRQQAEGALLDYHLDKREKDEEERAAERGMPTDEELTKMAVDMVDTYLAGLNNEEE